MSLDRRVVFLLWNCTLNFEYRILRAVVNLLWECDADKREHEHIGIMCRPASTYNDRRGKLYVTVVACALISKEMPQCTYGGILRFRGCYKSWFRAGAGQGLLGTVV